MNFGAGGGTGQQWQCAPTRPTTRHHVTGLATGGHSTKPAAATLFLEPACSWRFRAERSEATYSANQRPPALNPELRPGPPFATGHLGVCEPVHTRTSSEVLLTHRSCSGAVRKEPLQKGWIRYEYWNWCREVEYRGRGGRSWSWSEARRTRSIVLQGGGLALTCLQLDMGLTCMTGIPCL